MKLKNIEITILNNSFFKITKLGGTYWLYLFGFLITNQITTEIHIPLITIRKEVDSFIFNFFNIFQFQFDTFLSQGIYDIYITIFGITIKILKNGKAK